MKAWKVIFMWEIHKGVRKRYEIRVFARSRWRARRGVLGRCWGSRVTRVVRDFNADGAASEGALVVDGGGSE